VLLARVSEGRLALLARAGGEDGEVETLTETQSFQNPRPTSTARSETPSF
jgi:hypothetical protein